MKGSLDTIEKEILRLTTLVAQYKFYEKFPQPANLNESVGREYYLAFKNVLEEGQRMGVQDEFLQSYVEEVNNF